MEVTLARFGVETTFLPLPEPDHVAAAIRPTTKAVYVEMIANPSGMIPDLVGARRRRPRSRGPAGRRLDDGDAVPVPTDRARRRHRAALGHQVHRRTRHIAGRGDHRVGSVPVGQRPVSADDRADAGIRRAELVGQLRRVRISHPGSFRTTPRRRRHDDAVQRLLVPDGARDAGTADAPARRECTGGCAVPRVPTRWSSGFATAGCPTHRGSNVPSGIYPRAPARCLRSVSEAAEPPVLASSIAFGSLPTWPTSVMPARW